MTRLILGLLFILIFAAAPTVAGAESVRIQPLQYQTDLKKGEKKKGHVDITNPTPETITLKLYTQAFSQVDNKGNISFFSDEQISEGVRLDYDTVTLSARQTLRLFFIIDGAKLPTGDIFATIFAETAEGTRPGTNIAVRVGTLMMITNQTPGSRDAEIADLSVPFLQIGSEVKGSVTIKNPAPKSTVTGFFPQVTVSISPFGGEVTRKGPLIFAGNSRTVDFTQQSNHLGLYQVRVRANNATKTSWVFLITGWWRLGALLILAVATGSIVAIVKYRKKHSKRITLKPPAP